MRILSHYISKVILSAIAIVVFVLLGLELFILLAAELGDIGKGNYGIGHAFLFALLSLPAHLYRIFPAASLLGSLLGLGLLASRCELTVMRASGVSIYQITMAVLKAALLLIIIVTVMAEYIVPLSTQLASDQKAIAVSGGQGIRTQSGIWTRVGDSFVHIGSIAADHSMQQISRYAFDGHHRLQWAAFAKRGEYYPGHWHLFDVAISYIRADRG